MGTLGSLVFCFFHLARMGAKVETEFGYQTIKKATFIVYPSLWSEFAADYKPRKIFKRKYYSLGFRSA